MLLIIEIVTRSHLMTVVYLPAGEGGREERGESLNFLAAITASSSATSCFFFISLPLSLTLHFQLHFKIFMIYF